MKLDQMDGDRQLDQQMNAQQEHPFKKRDFQNHSKLCKSMLCKIIAVNWAIFIKINASY
jgi:hypothetical protein